VEFVETGQRGFTEYTDPHFSVAFVSTHVASAEHPAYIVDCAFHHGYAPAIGVFDATGVIIENNIIHHTWESGNLNKSLITIIIY